MEKDMATHSSNLASEIPWTEEPGKLYSPWGGKTVRHDLVFYGFPRWLSGKESACQCIDMGSIPGQEDPPKKEMSIHSSSLAWEIPWTEKPGGLQSMGLQKSWIQLGD